MHCDISWAVASFICHLTIMIVSFLVLSICNKNSDDGIIPKFAILTIFTMMATFTVYVILDFYIVCFS